MNRDNLVRVNRLAPVASTERGSLYPEHVTPDSAQPARDAELEAEIAVLQNIRRVQNAYIASAVDRAERLAAEAAEMTEEGIRDIYDEDAEADAAVAAALVRQTSDRAMHAVRRVGELKSAGQALAFGCTVDKDGARRYIGRLTVLDDDEPLLIDWRAPSAIPFYQATPLERMDVERRRNLHYGDPATSQAQELVGYSDDVFDIDSAVDQIGLRGEAALLASVSAPTKEQMRSVVATIQAEQDAIIRAENNVPLVVQGGPGTGKTVVALHRAAYLLYAQREALSDTGVLIIGPTTEFLNYIAGVLPSLGETGVISVTAPELYPGVRRGKPEDPEVAAIKGRLDMAGLLANAVEDRQRRPTEPFQTWYGARRISLPSATLEKLFVMAQRYPTHNEGADVFRFELIETLAEAVFDPSFHNREDARDHFRESDSVREFLFRHWPPLTPEQALNDLFGSKNLLRLAARGTSLSEAELVALRRQRTPHRDVGGIRWSYADIPLLDELLAQVGVLEVGERDDERIMERDETTEFELADQRDADDDLRFDDEADDDLQLDDEANGQDVSLDAIAAAAPGDPMFDTAVLQERFESEA